MTHEIPERRLQPLRERLGLESDDKSRDKEIQDRRPMRNLEELFAWEFGDSGWAYQIVTWMKDLGITKFSDLTNIY